MKLTEYLFHRLRELGVGHTFGIPGDFVLPVYAVQEQVGMPTVVCAHEPGVGFAADAYARFRGLGVALVTYGPGRSTRSIPSRVPTRSSRRCWSSAGARRSPCGGRSSISITSSRPSRASCRSTAR